MFVWLDPAAEWNFVKHEATGEVMLCIINDNENTKFGLNNSNPAYSTCLFVHMCLRCVLTGALFFFFSSSPDACKEENLTG